MSAAHEAARGYTARAWPVVPLHWTTRYGPKKGDDRAECSCRRPDCESQGKHPLTRRGLKEATTAPAVIAAWWHQWPDANVGILTGVAFDALDIDGPEGLDALDAAAPNEPPLVGPMAYTGRGLHLLTAVTGVGNRAGFVTGCDWRGTEGYIVGAGSIHHTGVRYEWTDLGPDTALQPVPRWLLGLLDPAPLARLTGAPVVATPLDSRRGDGSRYGLSALRRACERIAAAGEGTRNDVLNCEALGIWQLVAGGELTEMVADECLTSAAISAGLGAREVAATLKSARAAGTARPRRAS